MRTILLAACLAAYLLVGPVDRVGAQTQPSGTNVAVIDMSKVFKEYRRHTALIDELKKANETLEAELAAEAKRIEADAQGLKKFKPTTADYKALESKLASMRASLSVKRGLRRKELFEREADVWYRSYGEVYKEVAQFAERFNIGIVLRYNSEPMEPTSVQSVQEGVRRRVVYQNKLDITKAIINKLNAGMPPQQNLGQRPTIPRRQAP